MSKRNIPLLTPEEVEITDYTHGVLFLWDRHVLEEVMAL